LRGSIRPSSQANRVLPHYEFGIQVFIETNSVKLKKGWADEASARDPLIDKKTGVGKLGFDKQVISFYNEIENQFQKGESRWKPNCLRH
jgi:hypothetical protein